MNDQLILLNELIRVDAHELADHMTRYGVYRGDTLRALRRSRGIFMAHLDELRAVNVFEGLRDFGIPSTIASHQDIFPARPRTAPRILIEGNQVVLPHLEALGKQGRINLEDIRVVVVGLVLDSESHSLADVESQIMSGATSREDHAALARKSFEKATQANFPLHFYLLQRPEETVNMERLKRGSKEQKPKRKLKVFRSAGHSASDAPEAKRFTGEHPNMVARLYIVTDSDTWMVEAETAVWERNTEATSGHWVRPLHQFCSQLVTLMVPDEVHEDALVHPRSMGEESRPFEAKLVSGGTGAPDAFVLPQDYAGEGFLIPFDTLTFVRGFDQAPYLFEDEVAIHEYARWLAWRGNR